MPINDLWAAFPDAPPAIQPAGPQPPLMRGQAPPLPGPDPWAAFPDQPAPTKPMPTAVDVALSAGSGVARGAAETAMLPLTVPRLVDQYVLQPTVGRLAEAIVFGGEDLGRYLLGAEPANPQRREEARKMMRSNPLYDAQDAVRSTMDETLHKPQTTTGKYAETVGEFVPGGLFGKASKVEGFVNKGKALLGDIFAPAVTSEAAGEATQGTALEGPARFAGALAGGAGVGAVRARASAPEVMVRNSVPTGAGALTPAEWEKARQIQNNSQGITITGPEAIQQATGGRTRLGSLARVVEGSQPGGTAMLPTFAARPGQVNTATSALLDNVGPASRAPSTLGPQTQEVANNILDETRQGINASTRGDYVASASTPLPFVDLAKDPNYARTVDWVRSNLKGYENVADNSVEMADAVSKRLFDESAAAKNSTNSSFSNQVAAERGGSAAAVRDTARQNSPEYDAALNKQEAERSAILDPLEQGPVGKLAKTSDTREAYSTLMPKAPLTGGEDEIVKAVMGIAQRNPELASSLVRQGMADAYDTSAKRLVGGENQYAGARYAKEIAGSSQQEINMRAILAALPDDMAAAIFPEYLDVMRATGQRVPQGSATAFNNQIQRDASTGSLLNQTIDAARSAGTGLGTIITDATKRKLYGKNMGALGEMFVAPDSVDQIMEAIMRGGPSAKEDMIRSMIFTAPQQARQKSEERRP